MNSNQELVQMLKDLQIYNSMDNFFNPEQSQLIVIYEKFCDLINFDENLQLENSIMQLFYRCKLMCRIVGITDFSLLDITDPDPKRMKNILFQLCKYCIWQREQTQKWEKKIKEIAVLEDVEITQAQKQKNELEDIVQLKYRDLEVKKKRFEQLKSLKIKVEQEIQIKKSINSKLQLSIHQNQMELGDSNKKYNNLQEKLKVVQNELTLLESMIVKDPKNIEQKLNDSQRRMDSLKIEVDKCQKELQIEQFLMTKIYKQLVHDYDIFIRLMEQIRESELILQEEDKSTERLNDQIFTTNNKIQTEEMILQKLQQNKESLLQQKSLESEKNNSSHQYSLQSLIDLQNKLQELQLEQKKQQNEFLVLQQTKQEQQKLLLEADSVKVSIEANLRSVVNQQTVEIEQYSKNVESYLNKIEFE